MPANDERSGFRRWLDRRTGLDSLLDHALDEPIPGGAKIAYVFGSGLLFLFLSQIVTGVFLAMYYVPSADHAAFTDTPLAYGISRRITSYRSSPSLMLPKSGSVPKRGLLTACITPTRTSGSDDGPP